MFQWKPILKTNDNCKGNISHKVRIRCFGFSPNESDCPQSSPKSTPVLWTWNSLCIHTNSCLNQWCPWFGFSMFQAALILIMNSDNPHTFLITFHSFCSHSWMSHIVEAKEFRLFFYWPLSSVCKPMEWSDFFSDLIF